MNALAIILVVIVSTAFGVTSLLSYLVARMLRSDGWDKSNMTNALRVLSHVVMHPEDLQHMYYSAPSKTSLPHRTVTRKVYWYIDKDELSQVVATRPTAEERL